MGVLAGEAGCVVDDLAARWRCRRLGAVCRGRRGAELRRLPLSALLSYESCIKKSRERGMKETGRKKNCRSSFFLIFSWR